MGLLAEDQSQGAVEQVGRGVVAPDRLPAAGIDLRPRWLARAHEAFRHYSAVDKDVGRWLEGVIDVDDAGVSVDEAGVADLPARLAVEGCPVQDDLDRLPGFDFIDRSIRTDEPENACLG